MEKVIFRGAIYFIFHSAMLLNWISLKRKTLDSIFDQQQQRKKPEKFNKRKMNIHTRVCTHRTSADIISMQ